MTVHSAGWVVIVRWQLLVISKSNANVVFNVVHCVQKWIVDTLEHGCGW